MKVSNILISVVVGLLSLIGLLVTATAMGAILLGLSLAIVASV